MPSNGQFSMPFLSRKLHLRNVPSTIQKSSLLSENDPFPNDPFPSQECFLLIQKFLSPECSYPEISPLILKYNTSPEMLVLCIKVPS
jgi:hypothetical protein